MTQPCSPLRPTRFSPPQVAVFRQAMQRYTKRVAIAAVGVRPWVQRLQVRVLAGAGKPAEGGGNGGTEGSCPPILGTRGTAHA